MLMQAGFGRRVSALAVVLVAGLGSGTLFPASAAPLQAAAAPATGSRVSGTVTAIAGNTLTVKDDKGTESKVTVADSARVLQLPAGAKSLSAATPIKVSDIAVGDRILAKTELNGGNYTASTVIAMKQADVASLQQRELQDWKTKGVTRNRQVGRPRRPDSDHLDGKRTIGQDHSDPDLKDHEHPPLCARLH